MTRVCAPLALPLLSVAAGILEIKSEPEVYGPMLPAGWTFGSPK